MIHKCKNNIIPCPLVSFGGGLPDDAVGAYLAVVFHDRSSFPNATVTPKMHMMEDHVVELHSFMQLKAARRPGNKAVTFYSACPLGFYI